MILEQKQIGVLTIKTMIDGVFLYEKTLFLYEEDRNAIINIIDFEEEKIKNFITHNNDDGIRFNSIVEFY